MHSIRVYYPTYRYKQELQNKRRTEYNIDLPGSGALEFEGSGKINWRRKIMQRKMQSNKVLND